MAFHHEPVGNRVDQYPYSNDGGDIYVGPAAARQKQRAMTASDEAFTGSIPQLYDQMLVPMIFAPYAHDLAQRVAVHRPRDVLETAASTGAVTAALTSTLPPTTRITATDLNEPMLIRAKKRVGDRPGITWQQADALALPFPDASFDVVVCQFGAMFFPDKVKGYAEARRVLKTGGRLVFNVWDRIEENEFTNVVHQAWHRFPPTTRHASWPAHDRQIAREARERVQPVRARRHLDATKRMSGNTSRPVAHNAMSQRYDIEFQPQ
jgi:ubiquinone/menaquinone biosynthesis C-methylase UbiE